MNHTKEPWEVREFPDGSDCFITAEKEGKMAYGPEIMGDDYTGYGDIERKKADARRIVACVNACAGITNEALGAGIVLDSVKLHEAILGQQPSSFFNEYGGL